MNPHLLHTLAKPIASLWQTLQPERARTASRNLQLAFPNLRGDALQTTLQLNYQHLALTPLELLLTYTSQPQPINPTTLHIPHCATVTTHHREHLTHTLQTHNRALILTAHLGNFELALLTEAIHGVPITLLTKHLSNSTLNTLWHTQRTRHNIHLLRDDNSLSHVLQALREQRTVVMTLDQHANREHATTVPFFHRPALTHRSLAFLATRTKTPIVPVFAARTSPGHHTVTYHPPIHLQRTPNTSLRTLLNQHTAQLAAVVEDAIRQNPTQWTWLHNRWKSPPSRRAEHRKRTSKAPL